MASVDAGQYGDFAAPGTTVSIPDGLAFLAAILQSDGIQCGQQRVVNRSQLLSGPPGLLVGYASLAFVMRFFGGYAAFMPPNPITAAFEVEVTLSGLSGVQTGGFINLAQFMTSWNSTTAGSSGRDALLSQTFPNVNLAAYKLDVANYQNSLEQTQAAITTALGTAVKI